MNVVCAPLLLFSTSLSRTQPTLRLAKRWLGAFLDKTTGVYFGYGAPRRSQKRKANQAGGQTIIMKWPELCLRLVLALSLQSAAGFLSPRPFLARPNPVAATSTSGSSAVLSRRMSTGPTTARRLLLLRSPGSQLPRPRCSRLCGLSAAAPSTASRGRGDVRERRRRTASSNTALEARTGDGGLQRERDGGEGAEKGGGWRQRVVRTVVSGFLRIRAVVAALGSRLGRGRWSKVTVVMYCCCTASTAYLPAGFMCHPVFFAAFPGRVSLEGVAVPVPSPPSTSTHSVWRQYNPPRV